MTLFGWTGTQALRGDCIAGLQHIVRNPSILSKPCAANTGGVVRKALASTDRIFVRGVERLRLFDCRAGAATKDQGQNKVARFHGFSLVETLQITASKNFPPNVPASTGNR